MKRFLKTHIPFQWALWAMIIMNAVVIIFHLFVLSGIIPFTYVWGGKLSTKDEIYLFEGISLIINILIGWILLNKIKPEKFYVPEKAANFILYGLSVLFLLNTIGNFFATSTLEQLIATPLTLIAAVCCYRLAINASTDVESHQ